MSPGQIVGVQESLQDMQQRKQEQPYRLNELQTRSQMNAMSLQEMQNRVKKSQSFLSMAQQPGMLDENGTPTAQGVKAATGIDPEIGMAWGEKRTSDLKARTDMRYKDIEIQVKNGQMTKEKGDQIIANQERVAKAFNSGFDKNGEDPTRDGNAAAQDEAKRLRDSGLMTDEEYVSFIKKPIDKHMADAVISAGTKEKTPSEYEDILNRMKKLDPKSAEYKQLDERRKYMTEHPPQVQMLMTSDGKGVQVEPQRGGKAPLVKEFTLPGDGKGLMKMGTTGAAASISNPLGPDPDFWYDYYDKTKTLPPMAWGQAGNPTREAFLKGFPEWAKNRGKTGSDVGTDIAQFKSNASALTSLTKDLNTFEPYKKMLDTNADIAIQLGKKIYQTNAALANKPLNWLRQNATSNPDVAEYLAQMRFVQTEAARVINNPRIVGQLTDESRREMDHVIDGNAPIEVVERVLNRLKTDGSNRFNAMRSQQEGIVNTLKGGPPSPDYKPPSSPKPPVSFTNAEDIKDGYLRGDFDRKQMEDHLFELKLKQIKQHEALEK
jgi:hypothetical protein